jgi:hypothetical protein
MRKIVFFSLFLVVFATLASCSDEETYADQKKRERTAINKYIADSAVKVISETQFALQDSTTDVSQNEWVLFESSGVYMQIVRKGCGSIIKDGETVNVLCRYTELNLLTDSITMSNVLISDFYSYVDKMTVQDNSGTLTGMFVSGTSSLMYAYSLSSTSVPSGWLVPLSYVKLGRPSNENEQIAKVRIIVPHDMGHAIATQNVTPYLYDITYERGR